MDDIERKNFWDLELPEYYRRLYNNERDAAVEQIRAGNYVTHEEVMKELDLLFKDEKD